ncbi:glycosyltransferase family protein [Pectobacterium carotovorum]|uniref:glycosyltransferase n=1 Tax=Pectobacterium carotovorum TaxID=554 RepID=UPI002A7F2D74|nr:glycosyltransferase [Pectobacterium carotovorum]MDY4376085.1 glycosyltransferase [Pectobacterium carotovorum subsp. carotovorum]
MSNIVISILVVLYNTPIRDSSTVKSVIKSVLELKNRNASYNLLLWDNSHASSSENVVRSFCNEMLNNGVYVSYKHCPENKPLSEVYNNFICTYKEVSDYLMIFDQDSSFTSNFFNLVEDALSVYRPDLLLPIIKHKNNIVSPSKIYYIKGRYFKYPPCGNISPQYLSAINSGMVIASCYLSKTKFKYDNRLKNYCTDDYFMRQFRKNKGVVFVLDYVFEHDLSLSTLNENSTDLKRRYNELINGREVVYNDNLIEWILIKVYFYFHRIYMALRYKDLSYLRR